MTAISHKQLTYLFLGAMTAVLALSIVAPRAASFAAPLCGLLLTGAFWMGRHKPPLWPRGLELAFMAGIAGLAALSALWAIDPPFALERGYKLALILIPGLLFVEAARRIDPASVPAWFPRFLAGLYSAACVVITVEILCGLPLYHLINQPPPGVLVSSVFMNRSVVVMALFYLPLILIIAAAPETKAVKIGMGALSTLTLAVALFFTDSQSAQMFFILAILLFLLFPVRSKAVWCVSVAAIVLLAAASPWIAQALYTGFDYNNTLEVGQDTLDKHPILQATSLPHRLEIWNFIAEEIFKHPWRGQGIEAVRYIHAEQWLGWANADNMLHPHNAVLQIWVEYGVIGTVFACAFFLYIMHALWTNPPVVRRYQFAVVIGTLAVLCTGYGLWQSWLIGLLVALAGFTAFAGQYAKRQKA